MAAFEKYRSVYTHDELMEHLRRIRHVALDMDGTIYMGMSLSLHQAVPRGAQGNGHRLFVPDQQPVEVDRRLPAQTRRAGHTGDTRRDVHPPHWRRSTTSGALPCGQTAFPARHAEHDLEFEAAGFESAADSADDVPDVVVAAFDMTLQYDRLCRAAWWVSPRVCTYIATNPDRVCPTDQPTVLVDCSSICACIEHATGRRPDITLGKPDPNMLSGILSRHGLQPDQIAMVGDRIYTDVAMAQCQGREACWCSRAKRRSTWRTRPTRSRITADSIEVLGADPRSARQITGRSMPSS